MERVDICQNMPRFGWKEHALQRSFDPLHFVTHSDHGILWQGLVATYPPLVPPALVEAGRSSYKRLQMFRGQLDGKYSLSWGPQAMSLTLAQTKQSRSLSHTTCICGLDPTFAAEENWKIRAPVGIPLQCHFLRDIGHHHKSCQMLRQYKANVSLSSSSSSTEEKGTMKGTSGAAARFKRSRTSSGSFGGEGNNIRVESNPTSTEPELEMCLACETDNLFLEYFASMSGTSTIAALEEPEMPSSRSAPLDCNDNNKSLGFLLSSTSSNPLFEDASSLPSSSEHNSVSESAVSEVVVPSAKSNKDPKQMQGDPLIPSALLTAAWKSGRMDHLAGYEQRDAHEFLQAFLDIMGKHESQHYQLVKKMSSQANPSIERQDENTDQIEQGTNNDTI
eukprot:scaffold45125_cov60-Attheya_sp.AAC.2